MCGGLPMPSSRRLFLKRESFLKDMKGQQD